MTKGYLIIIKHQKCHIFYWRRAFEFFGFGIRNLQLIVFEFQVSRISNVESSFEHGIKTLIRYFHPTSFQNLLHQSQNSNLLVVILEKLGYLLTRKMNILYFLSLTQYQYQQQDDV